MSEQFLLPGDHPLDEGVVGNPEHAVDDHLYHLGTNLGWGLKNYDDFQKARPTDSRSAEDKFAQLGVAIRQVYKHFERLHELLRNGFSISPETLDHWKR